MFTHFQQAFTESKQESIKYLCDLFLYGEIAAPIDISFYFEPIIDGLHKNPKVTKRKILQELNKLVKVDELLFRNEFRTEEILVWGFKRFVQNPHDLLEAQPSYLVINNINACYIKGLSVEQWAVLQEISETTDKAVLFYPADKKVLPWQALLSVLQISSSAAMETIKLINNHFRLTMGDCDILARTLSFVGIKQLAFNLNYETEALYLLLSDLLKKAGITKLCANQALLGLNFNQWNWFCDALVASKISSFIFSNEFGNYTDLPETCWKTLFKALKLSHCEEFGLTNGFIDDLSSNVWIAIGNGIREAGIKKLDLSHTDLQSYTKAQWAKFTSLFSTMGINNLNLSKHDFARSKCLQGLFDSIASFNLNEINLSHTNLEFLSIEDTLKLGTALKASGIKSLIFEHANFDNDFVQTKLGCLLQVVGIKSLSLQFCSFVPDNQNWDFFCKHIMQSKLTSLKMDNCANVTSEQEKEIEKIMQQKTNPSLQYLIMSRLWALPENHDSPINQHIKNLISDNSTIKFKYKK